MLRLTLHFGGITHPQLPKVIKAEFKHFHIRLRSQTCYNLLGLIPNFYYVQVRSSYDQYSRRQLG